MYKLMTHILFTFCISRFHSVRNDFTGFAIAALID